MTLFSAINRCFTAAAIITLVCIITVSCKKEYINKYNTIAGDTIRLSGDNYITSFQVTIQGEAAPLKAALTTDSIIITCTSYQSLPDSVSPAITVADSASITPASGIKVAFKTGTKYTVTAQTGAKKEYVLKVDYRQPLPYFSSIVGSLSPGERVTFSGDNFLTDTSRTAVYLVNIADKAEYKAELRTLTSAGPTFAVPANAPPGLYDVKMVNGIYSIFNSNEAYRNNVTLAHKTTPVLYDDGLPATKKEGDTLAITGYSLQVSTVADIRLASNSTYYPLEIVSAAVNKLIVKMPAGLPAGSYNRIRIKGSGTSTVNISRTGILTITN